MKRSLLSLSLILSILTMTACHTMAGVGKDVEEVGEEVKETAEGR